MNDDSEVVLEAQAHGAAFPQSILLGQLKTLESTHLPIAEEEHRRALEIRREDTENQAASDKRRHDQTIELVHSWFARIVASLTVLSALGYAMWAEANATPAGPSARDIVTTALGASLAYLFSRKG
jgi:hypothetical protein